MALNMWRGEGCAGFMPTLADPESGPTLDEIMVGLRIDAGLNAINGLEPSRNTIDFAVLRRRQSIQVAGEETFNEVSLVFAEEDGTGSTSEELERVDIIETLVEGTSGWYWFLRNSQEPAGGQDIFYFAGTISAQQPSWAISDVKTITVYVNPTTPVMKGVIGAGS